MENLILDIEIDENAKESLLKKALKSELSVKEYIEKLVVLDINSTIDLENDYTYNYNLNKLYDNFNKEVSLTKIENALLELLLKNKGKIVKIETIAEVIWKDKEMTRFTLRNKIKSIRDKSFYELIVNHSNIGYCIN
ncbi:helix-turn-helix domain-containing protein [Poseidonibacter sp.]|uniref:helix-turn-helix domain-containing protein n=1 Tax=Poseidonibacter sp. TaxID=2321188 RepID=UPI003C78BDDB